MSKVSLKQSYIEEKGRICALCGQPILGDEYYDMDTDRIVPKAESGDYEKENYRVAHPECHMKRHGTFRDRPKAEDDLKEKVDDREQVMKLCFKINNQVMACKRNTDYLSQDTLSFLESHLKDVEKYLNDKEKDIKKAVKELSEVDPFMKSVLSVKGIGEMTAALCYVYIDLEKAKSASSLWSYAGLHASSENRYEKNKSSGGNKSLRTGLYRMAQAQVKLDGAYREVYDRAKAKKEKSEEIVRSRNRQGKMQEVAWKDTMKSHRHGHAMRAIMKHFLADYWLVGRTLSGLSTSPLYAEAVLKSGHRTIMPEERGWLY